MRLRSPGLDRIVCFVLDGSLVRFGWSDGLRCAFWTYRIEKHMEGVVLFRDWLREHKGRQVFDDSSLKEYR